MDPVTAGGLATAIGSMAATTKTIIETIKTARTNAKNTPAEGSLSEALEQIFSLQTSMIDLQAKILALQEENSHLRNKIRQEEERAKERSQYERKKVGRAVVMVLHDEPDTFYCTTCYAKEGKAIPIQVAPTGFEDFGSHRCTACETWFSIR